MGKIKKEENKVNKVESFKKDLENLKQKYNLDFLVNIDFPKYKILPVEVQLALEVIKKNDFQFVLNFKEI